MLGAEDGTTLRFLENTEITPVCNLFGHPDSIVCEESLATLVLGHAMLKDFAPGYQGGFVAPPGKRQKPTGSRLILKSFNGEQATHRG